VRGLGFTANRDARWDLASVESVLVWAAGAYPTVENSFSPHTDFPPGWESTATVARNRLGVSLVL
jgi:hypothetical protein